ncbi:MAG: hypothetical protein U5M53_05285 [Rhodoferax sp.]|nr:hypothetical protein [Rhodoferax sp.]
MSRTGMGCAADSMAAQPQQRAITQFGRLRVWDTEHNPNKLPDAPSLG